jgi:hypothetical protein
MIRLRRLCDEGPRRGIGRSRNLYAIDREYNDGRYSSVVQQAIAALVPR